MKTLTPGSNKPEMAPEDREFYFELGASTLAAWAIVMLV